MKISDLISQKQVVNSWNLQAEIDALNSKLTDMLLNIQSFNSIEETDRFNALRQKIAALTMAADDVTAEIDNLNLSVGNSLLAMSHEPLVQSYKMYEERKNWFNAEESAKVRSLDSFKDNPEAVALFDAHIKRYAHWLLPTLYVRPNSTHFINSLKANDTLYIAEQCNVTNWLKDNMEANMFKQIRFKLINENKPHFITGLIPANQLGLIVMEHFMHFKPLEVMKQYLTESMELLRPGGHLIFTYNNCDVVSGAKGFERGLYCFQPGGMVKGMCERVGFEIADETTTDRVSWFVLRKPGELASLKGSKTLGQIKTKE